MPQDELRVRPCLGSGLCCLIAPCALSVSLGHAEAEPGARCRQLDYDGTRYQCGLALGRDPRVTPEQVSAAVGGIGSGCGSPIGNMRRDRLKAGMSAEALG